MTKILVPSGWGAKLRACDKGPEVLKKYLSPPIITVAPQEGNDPLSIILDLNQRLSGVVFQTMDEEDFPLIIGGDHSIAVGTWNGVGRSFGLIWIDAHMDAHNFASSPSKAWHGMPLRALLEKNHELNGEACLKPENLCLIGVRAYEREELEFLRQLNVRIYFMEEVRERGLKAIFNEAKELVNKNTQGYGVSLDIDVVDPSDAPGVGSPEKDGIRGVELLDCLPLVLDDRRLLAFELVEFNPELDKDDKTLKLCLQILAKAADRSF